MYFCVHVLRCVYMDMYIFLRLCMVRFLILYVLVFFAKVSFSGKGLRVGNSSSCLFEPNMSS